MQWEALTWVMSCPSWQVKMIILLSLSSSSSFPSLTDHTEHFSISIAAGVGAAQVDEKTTKSKRIMNDGPR